MWTAQLVLLAIATQDGLPPPQAPHLVADVGRFAPLETSEDRAVGVDLASINLADDGRTIIDAYFLSKTPSVELVAGVTYSRALPSFMMKASLRIDCLRQSVTVSNWSRLTDMGYSILELSADGGSMTPRPSSQWRTIVETACSVAAQSRLPTLSSYVLFYDRMDAMITTASLQSLSGVRQ